jgi:acetolactate synthase I/II/III large subunit
LPTWNLIMSKSSVAADQTPEKPQKTMNGAESLVRTLVGGGVDVSFTNPGTSEMHFVAALDRVDGMRCILCLFEGVATGAADGYARMLDKPAATLLHLGPGMSNGMANIHNARKANSPMINVVGEHATYHKRYDAPLTSDIEGLAKPLSDWVRTGASSLTIAEDGRDAIIESGRGAGKIATLILPADTAWGPGQGQVKVPARRPRTCVSDVAIRDAARILERGGKSVALLLGDDALREKPLAAAAQIAAKTGCRILCPGSNARVERGVGRTAIDRVPYVVDAALHVLQDVKHIVLIGAKPPIAFFAYPGKPSPVTPADCQFLVVAEIGDDSGDALQRLADAVNAKTAKVVVPAAQRPDIPTAAPLNADSIGLVLGALIPEGAIMADESVTTGRNFYKATAAAPPHTWLHLTGGAIGEGMPLAIGAAVACPDRKVINLQADGSAMYTVQALWTEARENLNILTLIWANRAYAILKGELQNVGAENPGRKAHDMLSLENPTIDWVSLAKGLGVEGQRVATVDELVKAVKIGLKRQGPYLIEVVL